jgi:hypothetical protein
MRMRNRHLTEVNKRKEDQGKYPLIEKKHQLFAREVQHKVNTVIRVAFRQGKHGQQGGVWRTYEINFEKRDCTFVKRLDTEREARKWVYDAIPDLVYETDEDSI